MGVLLVDVLVVCVVGPSWYFAGRLAQRLKLPLITGYVLAGMLCGPYVLNLLTADMVKDLTMLDHACLSVIALAAGAELHLSELHKLRRQVTFITLAISLFTWVYCYAAMTLLAPYIPFTQNLQASRIQAIASLAATLMIARSPASAIAVLREMDGKGPYCSLVMSVVVVKDVVVFICFAINIEIASTLVRSAGGWQARALWEPLLSLFVSVWLGLAGGATLTLLQQMRGGNLRLVGGLVRRLPAVWTARLRVVSILLVSSTTFFLAEELHAEPLLACVISGLITTNRRVESTGRDLNEDLAAGLSSLVPLTNMAFFGLAGTSLRLNALAGSLWIAGLMFGVRLAAIYCGSWLGCWAGSTPLEHRRKLWSGMITQAGVAMGLAKSVAARFPDWGPDFATLMFAVIMMNLFTGPPLFRSAVVAAGEARAITSPALQQEFDEAELKRNSSQGDMSAYSAANAGHEAASNTSPARAGGGLSRMQSGTRAQLESDVEKQQV